MMESITNDKLQYLVFIGLSLVVVALTAVLSFAREQPFQRFIGNIHPLLAVPGAIILGAVLLFYLHTQFGFVIFETGNFKGILYAAGVATLLGIIIIVADTQIVFPQDTNILFPESLLFYPAIGFFVEMLFHILPLALLLFVFTSVFKNLNSETIIWLAILIVAFLEPPYHVVDMVQENQFPMWAVAFVGLHVFVFNFIQLFFFRRFDFVSMYTFRLVYYLFWHIGWGFVRLRLLF